MPANKLTVPRNPTVKAKDPAVDDEILKARISGRKPHTTHNKTAKMNSRFIDDEAIQIRSDLYSYDKIVASSKKVLIGVDPGEKGAIACIEKETSTLLFSFNFPLHLKWGHDLVDLIKLKELLNENMDAINCYERFDEIEVVFERVMSYGQGSKSAFVFGSNSLGLLNAFILMGFNVLPSVPANRWKGAYLLTGRPKSAAVEVANKVFTCEKSFIPEYKITGVAAQDELTIGQADAALIGLYGVNSVVISSK